VNSRGTPTRLSASYLSTTPVVPTFSLFPLAPENRKEPATTSWVFVMVMACIKGMGVLNKTDCGIVHPKTQLLVFGFLLFLLFLDNLDDAIHFLISQKGQLLISAHHCNIQVFARALHSLHQRSLGKIRYCAVT